MNVSALAALANWAVESGRLGLALDCERFARLSPRGSETSLPGLLKQSQAQSTDSGRFNGVLCIADAEADRLTQIAAVLSVGGHAILRASGDFEDLVAQLPATARKSLTFLNDEEAIRANFDVVLYHGNEEGAQLVLRTISGRNAPPARLLVVPVGSIDISLEALLSDGAGRGSEGPARVIARHSRPDCA